MNYEDSVYYILNKEEDFESGYIKNLKIEEKGISIEDKSSGMGVFISKFYDSYENNNAWNRLTLDKYGKGILKLTYYCADDVSLLQNEICNGNLSFSEIDEIIREYKIKTIINPFDIYINDAKKRFFWFKIEILNLKEDDLIINSIKVEFPVQSFLRYLPEIYQSDEESREFLEGYLGIYQSLYMDLERKIDSISSYFDPDITSREFLEWLCTWVKIDNSHIWKEDKLRYLLKNIVNIYSKMGTINGMKEIIELYASEKPYIVEYFQLKNYMKYIDHYDILSRLYSDNPYQFTVILTNKNIKTEKQYKALYKLINDFKPAHTEVRLVILKSHILLGGYCYLGVNSYLNTDSAIRLDGLSAVSFTKIDK